MMPAGHALPGNYSVQRNALMVMGSSRFMLKLLMPEPFIAQNNGHIINPSLNINYLQHLHSRNISV